MPEGVEVKISAELIKPLIINREVVCLDTYPSSRYTYQPPEGFNEFRGFVLSSSVFVKDIQTKGKFMYWTFSNGWYLLNTFGMSGQWSPTEGKHPCFSIGYWEKANQPIQYIYFNDPRHFGTIKFINNKKDLTDKLNSLGWDPLATPFDSHFRKYITLHLRCPKYSTKCIGEVLMNQSLFCGVGNYIRAEALYRAKISPWRHSRDLTDSDIVSLCQSVVYVMEESYQHQGATILTYKDAYGAEGKYSSCFKVYGKKTDPLGNIIKKEITPDKRAIHWCPAIQV
jgi:formamidopyrimidine-DNA glycosylase